MTAIESNPRCPRVIASMRERKIMSRPILFGFPPPLAGKGRVRAPLRDQGIKRMREPRVGVEHGRAPQFDPERIGALLGLDVDVVEDLEMVGDEPDRCNQDGAMALRRELLDRLDQVGAEPWLPRVTLTLVGEAPL